jgi:Transposase
VRFFGLDVHLDFCEVAVAEGGGVSRVGRIASAPGAIREFACDLTGEDQVVLEASCGAMMIARLLGESDVGQVMVCNAAETRAISHARVKSDRFDAAMLAKLLSAGMLKAVWVPDEATAALRRRVARRAGLVRARTRVKNEVHAVLARCLLGRPPVSDLFGKQGRVWLTEQGSIPTWPTAPCPTRRCALAWPSWLGRYAARSPICSSGSSGQANDRMGPSRRRGRGRSDGASPFQRTSVRSLTGAA